MEIQDVKRRLSILQVLEYYNIKPDKHHQICCPFHQDDKPSCKIYPKTNTFHCFGCGATGDQIEFIQKMEKCDKHQALKKAAELIGLSAETIVKREIKNTDAMGIAECQPALLADRVADITWGCRPCSFYYFELLYSNKLQFRVLPNMEGIRVLHKHGLAHGFCFGYALYKTIEQLYNQC